LGLGWIFVVTPDASYGFEELVVSEERDEADRVEEVRLPDAVRSRDAGERLELHDESVEILEVVDVGPAYVARDERQPLAVVVALTTSPRERNPLVVRPSGYEDERILAWSSSGERCSSVRETIHSWPKGSRKRPSRMP